MQIQTEPAHTSPFVDQQGGSAAGHTTNGGYVLTSHPGRSQGGHEQTSSSELVSQNGLPIRVSQQRPMSRELDARGAIYCSSNERSAERDGWPWPSTRLG